MGADIIVRIMEISGLTVRGRVPRELQPLCEVTPLELGGSLLDPGTETSKRRPSVELTESAFAFLGRRSRPPVQGVHNPEDVWHTERLAPVAQLDRASDFGSEGWGFESLRARFPNPCATRIFGVLGVPS